MSDNWIALIPEDPTFIPDEARQVQAREYFAEIAPDAEEIEIRLSDAVEFFDCGANFELVRCPSCQQELSQDWWQERLDEDADEEGFRLARYPMPCCQAKHTLHELHYDWPQGFGRFALDAMNPEIGELSEATIKEFERILGTKLHVIYQHI